MRFVRLNSGTEIFFMKVKVCAVWTSVISMYLPSQEPCLRFHVHSHWENKIRDWESKGPMLDRGLPAPQQHLALVTCPWGLDMTPQSGLPSVLKTSYSEYVSYLIYRLIYLLAMLSATLSALISSSISFVQMIPKHSCFWAINWPTHL